MPSTRTRSLTGRSPAASTSRIWRRRGSATALNASVVVATRAMEQSYTHMGICQPNGGAGPGACTAICVLALSGGEVRLQLGRSQRAVVDAGLVERHVVHERAPEHGVRGRRER